MFQKRNLDDQVHVHPAAVEPMVEHIFSEGSALSTASSNRHGRSIGAAL